MGFLISLRLKADLEECLEKLDAIVAEAQVERFMALGRSEGELSRYPQFRWMFPVFYALAIVLLCRSSPFPTPRMKPSSIRRR